MSGLSEVVDRLGWIDQQITERIRLQESLRGIAPLLERISLRMAGVFKNGGRVFFFGNGGSAADAQHWAAELSGRFEMNRPPLAAIALTINTSEITAISNDFGFENVFSRPLSGLARDGDMAVGITTSGTSRNVVEALVRAKDLNLSTVAFTGRVCSDELDGCDFVVRIPSSRTAHIQEVHEVCGHLICAMVEQELFG